MPRYYFNVHDGSDMPDEDGTELSDLAAAQSEAIRLAGALIRDHGDQIWTGGQWTMDVTDDVGLILFSLHFTATNASAVRH